MGACCAAGIAVREGARGANAVTGGVKQFGNLSRNKPICEILFALFAVLLPINRINFYAAHSTSHARAAIMSINTHQTAAWNAHSAVHSDTAHSVPQISEDWLSVIIGLFIFVLALAVLANVDLIGWVVTTAVWSNVASALGTASKSYTALGGVGALIATYVALLIVLSAAAIALKSDVKKFALAF